MSVVLPSILALGVFLASCSGFPAPVEGSDASLIVGQVTLDVRGTGSTNGLDGVINADISSYAVVTLVSVSDGKPHELRTTFPDGAFSYGKCRAGAVQAREAHSAHKHVKCFSRHKIELHHEPHP